MYRLEEHLAIMRRRRERFDRIEFHLVLWWVREGQLPTLKDAKQRLESLMKLGPSSDAFTFRQPYPPHGDDYVKPVMDECA